MASPIAAPAVSQLHPYSVVPPFRVHGLFEPGAFADSDLFSLLAGLLPVRFKLDPAAVAGANGVLAPLDLRRSDWPGGFGAIPSLRVARPSAPLSERRERDADLVFTHEAEVPFPFKGRSIRARIPASFQPLPLQSADRVLGWAGDLPWWSVRVEGGTRHYRCAFALPRVSARNCFQDVFNESNFPALLPFIDWLRRLSGAEEIQGPPLRACFMFDDPNLHWPTYGLVNFRHVAARAEKENYHVAFAMIPLDTWFTHRQTAELFRKHPTRLSLAVHGNNHTWYELARDSSAADRAALLNQAAQRIDRFERTAGLAVCRVMVPPHGACSDAMLASLGSSGFEAICVSAGSLRWHNGSHAWTRLLAYRPAEVIQGCTVLPRWGVSGPTVNILLLTAFLRQPLILRAHHQDLRGGLEILDEAARLINGLGEVRWSDLSGVSRGNYQWWVERGICKVQPLSRRVVVQLPSDARQVMLVPGPTNNSSLWEISEGGMKATVAEGETFGVQGSTGGAIQVRALVPSPSEAARNGLSTPLPVVARRLLVEGRDRLQGILLRWRR